MATIAQLMEGKKPGEIKLRLSSWPPTSFFSPFYITVDEIWHGLMKDGYSCWYRNIDTNWELYTEPKPKRKLAPYIVTDGKAVWSPNTFFEDDSSVIKFYMASTNLKLADQVRIIRRVTELEVEVE
jgi:hypothetical protein